MFSLPDNYNSDHPSSPYFEGPTETEQEYIDSQKWFAKHSDEKLVILKNEDGEYFSIEYSEWEGHQPCELIAVLDTQGNEIDFNLEGK